MSTKSTAAPLESVLAYHERTKHHVGRYARSAGFMDWATQPDPFRRYDGADLLPLDEIPPTPEPFHDAAYSPAGATPRPVDRSSVSQLFYDSLALSAWKELGAAKWSLRVNPSSGALHPTEGYLLAGPMPGLSETPALFHYSPFRHALEARAALSGRDWTDLTIGLPPGALLVGLTSIHWRESWKYGERAFRYCHHDAGHAIAAVALAAAVLGWKARLLEEWTDREMAILMGVASQVGPEAEHPDCLIAIDTSGEGSSVEPGGDERSETDPAGPPSRGATARRPAGADLIDRLSRLPMAGTPNRLSPAHEPWPVIDEVADATTRMGPPPPSYRAPFEPARHAPLRADRISAREIIRRRRSAVAMDGRSGLERETFYGMLERVIGGLGTVPFDALPWKPAVHLVLFVHRVAGLEAGLYALVRHPGAAGDLKASMRSDFEWSRADRCPEHLDLYLLARGDCRDAARYVSCHQEIAADGAFAAAMVAEFEPRLRESGPWFYKRLHWEAGAIGQVLYLEAEAAGVRATGIGCFFDDALHRAVGLTGRRYQDLYHFTVGGAVDDPRLRTAPAYAHLR